MIGNGSTGVQLLSRVAGEAQQVYAYVRTPQWVTPQIYYGEPITTEFRWLLDHMPYYWNWDRFAWLAPSGESIGALFVPDLEWQANGGVFSKMSDELRERLTNYIKTQTGHREDLYSRLIPACPPWARRMIVDNNWYRTLTEDHVELVTDAIDYVDQDAIVTTDGKRREVDVIIAASGFDVTKYMFPIEVRGRGGVTLEDRWERRRRRAAGVLEHHCPGLPEPVHDVRTELTRGRRRHALERPAAVDDAHRCVDHQDGRTRWQGDRGQGGRVRAAQPDAGRKDVTDDLDGPRLQGPQLLRQPRPVQSMNAWAPTEHWKAMTDPDVDVDFMVT